VLDLINIRAGIMAFEKALRPSMEASSEKARDEDEGGKCNDGPTDAEEPSLEEEDGIFRGELLKISNFLSRFRSYFSWNDSELFDKDKDDDIGFMITPHDIESAIYYRFLLQSKQRLLDQQRLEVVVDQEEKQLGRGSNNNNTKKNRREEAADKGNNTTTSRGRRQQRIHELMEYVDLRVSERTDAQKRRDPVILQMLERLQVWGTKDLTHELLMPICDSPNLEEASTRCWSKFLHLPGAVHFADRCPPSIVDSSTKPTKPPKTKFSKLYHIAHVQRASHLMCSLALPPNSHNWQEFARIAEMVSFLPKDKRRDAEDSPCNGTLHTMQIYSRLNGSNKRSNLAGANNKIPTRRMSIYSEDFNFQPHDLVALWVRAQRNAVAMRHLIQLFTRPNSEELARMKEQRRRTHNNFSTGTRDEHRLVFRGNHKSTKHRVPNESKQVKALVEWAVMNQFLFRYRYMQCHDEAQKNAVETTGPKKRHKSGDLGQSPSRLTKRFRSPEPVKADLDAPDSGRKLLRACYRYILRWFSRRNLPIISSLFFSKLTVSASPAVQTYHGEQGLHILRRCKEVGITDVIHQRLRDRDPPGEDSKSSSDRTLARIDRRLLAGKFDVDLDEYDFVNKESPFFVAVSRLLRVWGKCLEELCSVDSSVVQAVIADFETLYNNFHCALCENGIVSAAKTLLELSSAATEKCQQSEVMVAGYLEKQLLGLASPWNETCSACVKTHTKKKNNENKETHRICDYCERAYAEGCYPSSNFFCKDMQQGLRRYGFFSVDIPESEVTPDYRGTNASKVKWEAITLTLIREIKENGELETAGLKIRQCNASRDAMDYVMSGRLDLAGLNSAGFIEEFPVGFGDEVDGCLITDVVQGSAGGKAGLRKNDVIVGLEFVTIVDGAVSPPSRTHYLRPLSKESRLDQRAE
jgi:hypothetical protein